jgi:hypothetical protein
VNRPENIEPWIHAFVPRRHWYGCWELNKAAPYNVRHHAFHAPNFYGAFDNNSSADRAGLLLVDVRPIPSSCVCLIASPSEPLDKAIVTRNMATRGKRKRFVQEVKADLASERVLNLSEMCLVSLKELEGRVGFAYRPT